MKHIIVGSAVIIALAGAGARAYYTTRGDAAARVVTSPVTRGDIVQVVSATGTVEAVTTVQVGSQVSGTVSWLGADFNSIVRKGQVIAKLDPALFDAQVQQSRANVTKARAGVESARVQLADAEQTFTRATELAARQLLAASALDAAKVRVDSASADVRSAQAQVVQAQAALDQNQVGLAHTIMTSPIDGIVVQRSVDVGQTVAASLQSPTIFAIAADLTKMRVNAAIDESDIGSVQPGQAATFTVDAYPGETFTGVVAQVRLQPSVVQNVTTYVTMINVENAELKLKPGMTAISRIEIARRTGVLRVASAALRFRPTSDTWAALDQTMPAVVPPSSVAPGVRLWAFSNGSLTPVAARLGITDGVSTELLDTSIEPGTAVVAAVTTTSAAASVNRPAAGNPLLGGRP